MTERYAFKMFLKPGCAAEYRRRHDVIWPELVCPLTEAGVANYSIHLDQETSIQFVFLERGGDHRMEALPNHPVMRRWWGSHEGHHAHASRRLTGLDPAH